MVRDVNLPGEAEKMISEFVDKYGINKTKKLINLPEATIQEIASRKHKRLSKLPEAMQASIAALIGDYGVVPAQRILSADGDSEDGKMRDAKLLPNPMKYSALALKTFAEKREVEIPDGRLLYSEEVQEQLLVPMKEVGPSTTLRALQGSEEDIAKLSSDAQKALKEVHKLHPDISITMVTLHKIAKKHELAMPRSERVSKYDSEFGKYVASMVAKHGSSTAQKILNAPNGSKLARLRDSKIVSKPLRISYPTVRRLAQENGVELKTRPTPEVRQYIAHLAGEHGAVKARRILAAANGTNFGKMRDAKLLPEPLDITPSTVRKYADEFEVEIPDNRRLYSEEVQEQLLVLLKEVGPSTTFRAIRGSEEDIAKLSKEGQKALKEVHKLHPDISITMATLHKIAQKHEIVMPRSERLKRPDPWGEDVRKEIAALVEKHGTPLAVLILNARKGTKRSYERNAKVIPHPLHISAMNVRKIAKEEGVELRVGRPVLEAVS